HGSPTGPLLQRRSRRTLVGLPAGKAGLRPQKRRSAAVAIRRAGSARWPQGWGNRRVPPPAPSFSIAPGGGRLASGRKGVAPQQSPFAAQVARGGLKGWGNHMV